MRSLETFPSGTGQQVGVRPGYQALGGHMQAQPVCNLETHMTLGEQKNSTHIQKKGGARTPALKVGGSPLSQIIHHT